MASETAQRHVREIVDRDNRQIENLIQSTERFTDLDFTFFDEHWYLAYNIYKVSICLIYNGNCANLVEIIIGAFTLQRYSFGRNNIIDDGDGLIALFATNNDKLMSQWFLQILPM